MAKLPTKTSGSRMSNIMDVVMGNIDFKSRKNPEKSPLSYGSPELISTEHRTKILAGALRVADHVDTRQRSAGSLMSLMQTTSNQQGKGRLENRKILQLMPEVDKAARLMVASIFSPNDLSRHNVSVSFNNDSLQNTLKNKLNEYATDFFQRKLNLKTAAPSWVYQFGYESGSAVFAIIPLRSFEKIQEDSFAAKESLTQFVEKTAQESLFGFSSTSNSASLDSDCTALESFSNNVFLQEDKLTKDHIFKNDIVPLGFSKDFVKQIIAQEVLSLTDNPSILQAKDIAKKSKTKKTKNVLDTRFRTPLSEHAVSLPLEDDDKESPIANPIFMRLPPESVTVIHTPGDPNDHQGYLVLLDLFGNPISILDQEDASTAGSTSYNMNQSGIFNQTYQAYGLNGGSGFNSNQEAMGRIYSQIVTQHLKNRLEKAGFSDAEFGNTDSVMRCMFTRFLGRKQTRILFLPKELVTYMTFEMDQNGYGVSRLDRIKFYLGMKMALQVSRVMAAIKAAMDKRKIDIRFTENMLEQPEAIIQNVIQQFTAKQTMGWSIDPNVMQAQIVDKSISIKGSGIPGMEEFDLTNESDSRNGPLGDDSNMLEYVDKQITNGMRIPASTMNSLNEDEYARSVTTTNLFFSMDVSMDQDIVIKHVSDVTRKFARYSEEFQKGILDLIPSLGKSGKNSKSSTDEMVSSNGEDKEEIVLPEGYTLDKLIGDMVITLPKPNVAPSKAQFESLEAMVTAITNVVNACFPDEVVGADDTLRSTVGLIRSKFISTNVREYLDGSGMTNFELPGTNFTDHLTEISDLSNALKNIAKMIEDRVKLSTPAEPTDPAPAGF